MLRALSLWNLLGLTLFLLGALALWRSQGGQAPAALPLPSEENPAPNRLSLQLYRPTPPQGFVKEVQDAELSPGETPEGKALALWAEALSAPVPKALFRRGKELVVDLPEGFAQGLDAPGEVYRLYSLAYTLLATFPQAEEVRFLVEGTPQPGLAHLDLQKPFRLP